MADHLRPVSEGGQNTQVNLVSSCSRCNGARRNARMAELAGRAIAAGLHLRDTETGGGPPPPERVPTGRPVGRPKKGVQGVMIPGDPGFGESRTPPRGTRGHVEGYPEQREW